MQYRSFDLTNKFLVIVTTCKGYIDEFIYDTNRTVFDNDEFDTISALITIIQDIKDNYIELAKEYVRKHLKSSSSYEYKQKLIKLYLKGKVNINITNDNTKNILDKIHEFIPEYDQCEGLSDVIIIKDKKLIEVEVFKQTDSDIKQAVQYITSHLNTLQKL
jgi:hypothetical protein